MNSETYENNETIIALTNATTDYLTSNIWVQGIFYLLYGTIFIIGVFGNALVCYVVVRNKQMQTVTNLFITNLALSDVLLCVLAVPFTPLYTFLGKWIFGQTLCHLVPYAQGVSIYISTFTLTSIAVDRFLVIIYPFHPRMRIQVCLAIIIGIWIIALLLTLPYGLYMTLEEQQPYYNSSSPTYCEEHWPSLRFRKLFSSFTSILQFVVPFFIIAFCYICVSMRLNDRAKSKPGSKTGSRKEEADRERKRRTNRMLIAMVTIFGVCWLPLNMLNVVDDFYADTNHWTYYRLCFFIIHWLAMSSTCYNPFLYAWLNDNFRKEFTHVLPFVRTARNYTPRTTTAEAYRSERLCNGNDTTLQESLLSSLVSRSNQTTGAGESIQLESRPVLTPVFHPTERTIDEFTDVHHQDIIL